jgi:hypothetical protein
MDYKFAKIKLIILVLIFFNAARAGQLLTWRDGDKVLGIALKNKVETFYGANTNFLSGCDLDKILFWQGTWDFTLESAIEGVIMSRGVGRIKTRWGNPDSIIRTTEAVTQVAGADQKPHRHFIGKQLPWIREAWVEINLNKVLNIECENKQVFRAGAFSFRLGRGISLGDAYAVNPGVLGFYSNDSIDQYAFGFLLHGEIIPKCFTYDMYVSILENKTDNFGEIAQPIYANEIGRKNDPFRGFGHINYVLAGRFQIYPFAQTAWGSPLLIEPYVMYNHNPEQKIEFTGDASLKLATTGIMLDWVGERLNWNFEAACNFGAQSVKAWDRNVAVNANRNGFVVQEYTEVREDKSDGKNALVNIVNKPIVINSAQGVEFNCKQISEDPNLWNSCYRFNPAYKNKLEGTMALFDIAYWFIPDQLRWAWAIAYASGDENPNKDINDPNDSSVDGIYSGFVPFQEIYTGKYVDSVFILSGNVPRPMSMPASNLPSDMRYSFRYSGFTNLVYFGSALQITPYAAPGLKLRPNVIAYWQQHPTKKFDLCTLKSSKEYADKFLGTEINLFLDWNVINGLKAFFVGGMLFPGQHYKDIARTVAFNSEQFDAITLNNNSRIPVLGSSIAYSLNGGFEYIF